MARGVALTYPKHNMRTVRSGHGGCGSDDIGTVHLPGCGFNAHETLCGYVDSYILFEETQDPVTCAGCLEAARMYLPMLRAAKRTGRWK